MNKTFHIITPSGNDYFSRNITLTGDRKISAERNNTDLLRALYGETLLLDDGTVVEMWESCKVVDEDIDLPHFPSVGDTVYSVGSTLDGDGMSEIVIPHGERGKIVEIARSSFAPYYVAFDNGAKVWMSDDGFSGVPPEPFMNGVAVWKTDNYSRLNLPTEVPVGTRGFIHSFDEGDGSWYVEWDNGYSFWAFTGELSATPIAVTAPPVAFPENSTVYLNEDRFGIPAGTKGTVVTADRSDDTRFVKWEIATGGRTQFWHSVSYLSAEPPVKFPMGSTVYKNSVWRQMAEPGRYGVIEGSRGVVVGVDSQVRRVEWETVPGWKMNKTWFASVDELTAEAPKPRAFQVGDRVVALRDCKSYQGSALKGTRGRVVDSDLFVIVRFDNGATISFIRTDDTIAHI